MELQSLIFLLLIILFFGLGAESPEKRHCSVAKRRQSCCSVAQDLKINESTKTTVTYVTTSPSSAGACWKCNALTAQTEIDTEYSTRECTKHSFYGRQHSMPPRACSTNQLTNSEVKNL